MAQAKDVTIVDGTLELLRQPLLERLAEGVDSVEEAFGTTGSLDGDINLIFFETAANFCFWAENDADRWRTSFEGRAVDGWYGLSRAFYKAVRSGVPVYDASYVAGMRLGQAAELFAGMTDVRIPLLEVRLNNLIEAAGFLLKYYDGSGHEFIKDCGMSAPRIAEVVTRQLSSFRDGGWYGGQWMWMLKRAQILPSDLSQLAQKYPGFEITGLDDLTVFADYRLPQVLRHYGILKYSSELSKAIDSKQIIAGQSDWEIEIRSATIKACEQLWQLCDGRTISDIDKGLWLLSQGIRHDPAVLPYHLTISQYY